MAHPLFTPEVRLMLEENNEAAMAEMADALHPATVAEALSEGAVEPGVDADAHGGRGIDGRGYSPDVFALKPHFRIRREYNRRRSGSPQSCPQGFHRMK